MRNRHRVAVPVADGLAEARRRRHRLMARRVGLWSVIDQLREFTALEGTA
jgi:hypothetical protein